MNPASLRQLPAPSPAQRLISYDRRVKYAHSPRSFHDAHKPSEKPLYRAHSKPLDSDGRHYQHPLNRSHCLPV